MDKEEWLMKCAARFETLGGLHIKQARDFAEAALENLDGDLTENPEEAADEDMTRWEE